MKTASTLVPSLVACVAPLVLLSCATAACDGRTVADYVSKSAGGSPGPMSCTPPDPTAAALSSLAEAKGNAGVGIEVDFGPLVYRVPNLQPIDPGQPELNVFLTAWPYGSGGPYVVLAKTDATVTLDGQTSVPPVDLWTCYDPQYHADAVPWPRSTARVTLTDATGSLEADFVNLDAPRTFMITAPGGSAVHVGDTMAMQLSPGTDVFPVDDNDTAHYGLVEVDFLDPSQILIAYAYATVHGAAATVVVPAEAAGATSVQLIEEGTVGTTRCDVGHCDIVFDLATPSLPLAVMP